MTNVERAMTGECFYRHGDECRNTHYDWTITCLAKLPGYKIWERACDFKYAQADKIRVLQAEVRRLNELLPM
jgi:hypothetical protein